MLFKVNQKFKNVYIRYIGVNGSIDPSLDARMYYYQENSFSGIFGI